MKMLFVGEMEETLLGGKGDGEKGILDILFWLESLSAARFSPNISHARFSALHKCVHIFMFTNMQYST